MRYGVNEDPQSLLKLPSKQLSDAGHSSADSFLEVLGLYRKREEARRMQEHGVFARFRYNDLKEAGGGCGGRGPYGN